MKHRNPWFVVLVSFFTAYLYALYWFYKTRKELNELTSGTTSPLLWLVGLFVPLVNLYVIWKYCKDVQTASNNARGKVLLFVLWIIFIPAAQYLIQAELNKLVKPEPAK